MLISSMLGLAALATVQRDPTQPSRDAFTRCLYAYAESQARARVDLAAFETGLAQQCMTEEGAFREAIRVQLTGLRVPAARIAEDTRMEIEDARGNTKARFEDAITPR